MNNSYLITQPDGNKLIYKGQVEDEGSLVWLCKHGKRLWWVPSEAIRLLDPVEALVFQANGARVI
jgi:hypothetical protein